MVDLLIPLARRVPVVVNPFLVPHQMDGWVSGAIRDPRDLAELPHAYGGREVKPEKPLILWASDGTSIIIMGAGEADAAEIQDCAYAALDKAEENIRKRGGRALNFDELREKERLPRREDVDAMVREAMRRRAQQHLENPITDPPRVPQYYRGDEE